MLTEDRIPQSPPHITPVRSGENRPLWSVMIPAYNCIHYLKETIESVLAQDPGPEKMQIEVGDDYSTDGDVGALVQEVGKGRITFFRQEKNRGSLRNFETCLNRSIGHWVHLLHGDDLVKPRFYSEIEGLFHAYPQVGAAFTKHSYINERGYEVEIAGNVLEEPGVVDDWLLKIAGEVYLQPPAIVFKTAVYEQLASFFAVHYGEDWEMWTRIAAHFPVAYSPKCLAMYRKHGNNISSRSFLSGQSLKDVVTVTRLIQQYLPDEKRSEVKKAALTYFSKFFAKEAYKVYPQHPEAALRVVTDALKMSFNRITFSIAVRLYTQYFAKSAARKKNFLFTPVL